MFNRRYDRQMQYLMLVPLQMLFEYSDVNNIKLIEVGIHSLHFPDIYKQTNTKKSHEEKRDKIS